MKCPKCQTDNPGTSSFCADCGTRLGIAGRPSVTLTLETTTDELIRGVIFAGRYEIVEELGAGGMGRVYRAFDRKVGEDIALKLIKSEIATDRKTVERFRNELKTARRIRHKNVCGMFDLHEEGKSFFITMEYIRGEDLKSLLRRTQHLAVATSLSIARQVAEGLGEAHKLGVVHRDLKSGNIMIDKEGQAKIMDFGIARTPAAAGTTAEGVIIGTPEYMSPEQVDGKPVDARADIYSLGIVLFEMLIGRVPFEGETAFSIAHKHKDEAPPDPRKFNHQISGELGRLILRCLEKDREKRYQTTEEFLADLGAVEEALPITDWAPTGRSSTRSKPRVSKTITVKITPRKLLIPAAAVVIIAAVLIGLGKFLVRKAPAPAAIDPGRPPSVAILYFKNNSGDKNLDGWKEELCTSLIIKLSQSRYFRVVDLSQINGILKRLKLSEQDSYTQEDLKAIASGVLATHIVQGSFSKAGERLRVNLILRNAASLEVIASEMADGKGEESIYDMIDDLGDRVKSNLGLSTAQQSSDIYTSIKDITASPEAFKFYVQGYQFLAKGLLDQALASCQKAVSADPRFAMAYLIMAICYHNKSMMKESLSNFQKAFDLKEGVSKKERLIIEAEYYSFSSERTWDKAVSAFSELLELYPWDISSNIDLGFLYTKMDEWDKAIECYETLRRYKSDVSAVYAMLAANYLNKGLDEKAAEALEGYLSSFGDNELVQGLLGTVYAIQGDLEKAGRNIEKAYGQIQEPNYWFKLIYSLWTDGFAAAETLLAKMEASPMIEFYAGARSLSSAFQGKVEDAKISYGRELTKMQDSAAPSTLAFILLNSAHLLEKASYFAEALSACDRSLSLAQKADDGLSACQALYRRGVIQARQGKFEESLRTAEEIRRTIEGGLAKKRMNYVEGLLGIVALLQNDARGCRDHLLKALPLTPVQWGMNYNPRPEFLECLAEAYEREGRWGEAQKTYEELQSLKLVMTLGAGNALIFSRSYYRLGKVLERQGNESGAAQNYLKFLGLWRNADLGRPEVEDARKRLSALKLYP